MGCKDHKNRFFIFCTSTCFFFLLFCPFCHVHAQKKTVKRTRNHQENDDNWINVIFNYGKRQSVPPNNQLCHCSINSTVMDFSSSREHVVPSNYIETDTKSREEYNHFYSFFFSLLLLFNVSCWFLLRRWTFALGVVVFFPPFCWWSCDLLPLAPSIKLHWWTSRRAHNSSEPQFSCCRWQCFVTPLLIAFNDRF